MKKIVSAVLIILTLIFGTIPVGAIDTEISTMGTASTQFVGIAILSINLSIDSWGCATTTGSVRASSSSYTSYLTVSLQQYTSSGWITVQSWSGSGVGLPGVIVEGSRYVASGTYRSCSSTTVFNSSGAVVDAATAYSAEQIY